MYHLSPVLCCAEAADAGESPFLGLGSLDWPTREYFFGRIFSERREWLHNLYLVLVSAISAQRQIANPKACQLDYVNLCISVAVQLRGLNMVPSL